MGKVVERISSLLVPEDPDRHANKIDIYRTKGRLYHVNFRNVQIRLTREQFNLWKNGFNKASEKLGGLMANDTLEPWEDD